MHCAKVFVTNGVPLRRGILNTGLKFVKSSHSSPFVGGKSPFAPKKLPFAKYVVAVASGKGGVVYWFLRKPELDSSENSSVMLPKQKYGLQVMSMGFLIPEEQQERAFVWRGPMVGSAIEQMLYKVKWSLMDFLVIDLPPGTGDAQLSISQRVRITGAVIVSTPQDIALIDAKRENMSYFICSQCGHREPIFGERGVEMTCQVLGVSMLGAIPLRTCIRETCDRGVPITKDNPGSEEAACFQQVAEKVKNYCVTHASVETAK
ncbi:Iron-sulfur cluster carrier protein [Galdieria sulphuraria]|nr:Iron-sulfur cluster carrier protein [Galdieria sulphuraria]